MHLKRLLLDGDLHICIESLIVQFSQEIDANPFESYLPGCIKTRLENGKGGLKPAELIESEMKRLTNGIHVDRGNNLDGILHDMKNVDQRGMSALRQHVRK